MKKRILSLVAALALAATVAMPVSAKTVASSEVKAVKNGSTVEIQLLDSNGNYVTKAEKDIVNYVVDTMTDQVKMSNSDLKPSGAPNAKVNVVTGDAKDNIMDNGVKPAIKEFVKVTEKRAKAAANLDGGSEEAGKAGISKVRGIYYFNLTADQAGDVTFKIDDSVNSDAMTGDAYAIVLHYTGNAADSDGVTAQYCKISSAGKVTAHFNSFSPVAIIATTCESAQTLVNTYSHSAGSDAGNAAATTTPAVTAPVVDPNAAVAAPVDGAAAAAGTTAANGKGAASPKTSDNAYAMYLILAVAAVAGTTLVATKKTR